MRLSYEIDSGAGVQNRELPFVIGVLADLTGQPVEPLPRLRDRKFVEITEDNLDSALDSMKPRVTMAVSNELTKDGSQLKIDLRFRCMEDFEPEQVARQAGPLRSLLNVRQSLDNLLVNLSADARLEAVVHRCLTDTTLFQSVQAQLNPEGGALIDFPLAIAQILSQCGWSESPWVEWTERGTAACLAEFMAHASEHPMPYSTDAAAMIQHAVSGIEQLISAQLDLILHHPAFKSLEAVWRGIVHLLDRCRDLPSTRIKVLNVSKRELLKDLQRAPEFDQSTFFRFGYGEFGTLGGEPFGLFIGAYQFSRTPEDIELLERVSQVAASAHSPFLASVEPSLLQLDSFEDLDVPRSLSRVFETTAYARWAGFRLSEESRYVGLVLPRILLRGPRQPVSGGNGSTAFFPYREKITSVADLLWGNAAFALAATIAQGMAKTGLAEVTIGSESGGLASSLPAWSGVSDDGSALTASATDVPISDARLVELTELGFIPLCQRKNSTEAVFFDLPTCYLARVVEGRESLHLQQRLSARLENVIVASRFAHYIKCIMRDKIGTFTKIPDWEKYLDAWIKRYVIPEAGPADAAPDDFPLSSGSISVETAYGYGPRVIVNLRPRFRNRATEAALRLVVGLPQMREVH